MLGLGGLDAELVEDVLDVGVMLMASAWPMPRLRRPALGPRWRCSPGENNLRLRAFQVDDEKDVEGMSVVEDGQLGLAADVLELLRSADDRHQV